MSGPPVPLRPALKAADEGDGDRSPSASGSLKAVQIAEPVPEPAADDECHCVRQFRASPARRLSGKPAPCSISTGPSASDTGSPSCISDETSEHQRHHLTRYQYYSEKLLSQVGEWLEHERHKAGRRLKTSLRQKPKSSPESNAIGGETALQRTDSIGSQSSDVSFDRLQSIIDESLSHFGLSAVPRSTPKVSRSRRRANSRTTLSRNLSSDTDYLDGDAIVPGCDACLDNSKTIGFPSGSASAQDVADLAARAEREREAWLTFKNDIIRITHTLKLKGWRRVGLEQGDSIGVERLSGALTNAVYVVTPPSDLPDADGKNTPTQLLLRIYGPQVEQLIDRCNELKVLQRLARKKIGPRLLGTFKNGRFEEYFNAVTLRAQDIRDPDTSRQIAKRMRELHDGMELLPQERDNGPGVWKNWDQWIENVTKIMTYLDKQLEQTAQDARHDSVTHAWKANGYVCGVPFPQFRETVAKYRAHVKAIYGDPRKIKERLVFAHNDTQYGNILRLRPDDEKSPLLQAANKHKQLIVIDFEYAAANLPGLDMANHFTEWSYNYHEANSHACDVERYPKPEEQRRFIKAYVDHRPQFPAASSTPRMRAVDSGSSSSTSNINTPSLVTTQSSSSIIDFMLDARAPQGGWGAAEREREERSNQRVRELMEEARLWRPANSALWVAWGIVQATVPGLDANNEPLPDEAALKAEQETGVEDFDYLGYAQDRALFFWGDVVQMGILQADELPETLRARLKKIDY